jgi:hypothetical protein
MSEKKLEKKRHDILFYRFWLVQYAKRNQAFSEDIQTNLDLGTKVCKELFGFDSIETSTVDEHGYIYVDEIDYNSEEILLCTLEGKEPPRPTLKLKDQYEAITPILKHEYHQEPGCQAISDLIFDNETLVAIDFSKSLDQIYAELEVLKKTLEMKKNQSLFSLLVNKENDFIPSDLLLEAEMRYVQTKGIRYTLKEDKYRSVGILMWDKIQEGLNFKQARDRLSEVAEEALSPEGHYNFMEEKCTNKNLKRFIKCAEDSITARDVLPFPK